MKYILKIVIFGLNIVYFFLKLFPSKNRVVMMSRQSNYVNVDFRLLGDKLQEKYEVIYLCKTLDGKENAKVFTMISYGFHMFKQMYYLATSRVCILDTYIPVISILKHKKNLTIIQMWHSNGTMKNFGYSSLGKREGTLSSYAKVLKMHEGYSYVLCSGEGYVDHLVKGFHVSPDIIKIYSLPRLDLLTNIEYETNAKNKIFQKYPCLNNGKENVLYAPTFRKDEHDFNVYFKELVDSFDYDKYNLIIKLHPLSKVHVQSEKAIVDNSFSTFDMLFVTDKMISDYSCIIYEAGVRDIPLYFYAYDLSYYDYIRGLALDYKELPGYTENDAKKLVKDLDKKYDMNYYHEFMFKYVRYTKDCTLRLAQFVDECISGVK